METFQIQCEQVLYLGKGFLTELHQALVCKSCHIFINVLWCKLISAQILALTLIMRYPVNNFEMLIDNCE